jgi:serum/glucocorticoid-regulated kinase 2
LLLEHGADPNVVYHDLGGWKNYKELGKEWKDKVVIHNSHIPAMLSCGRAVQITLKSGFPEIARVLVEAGADVELPQQVWDVLDHVCQPVPRGAYLEILDGLRAVVAGIGSEK